MSLKLELLKFVVKLKNNILTFFERGFASKLTCIFHSSKVYGQF